MAVDPNDHQDARSYYNALFEDGGGYVDAFGLDAEHPGGLALKDASGAISHLKVIDGVIHVEGEGYHYSIDEGDVVDHTGAEAYIPGALPIAAPPTAQNQVNVGHTPQTAPHAVPESVNAPERTHDIWGVKIQKPARSVPQREGPRAKSIRGSLAWNTINRRGMSNQDRLWLSDVQTSKDGEPLPDIYQGRLVHHENQTWRIFNDGSAVIYHHQPGTRTEGVDKAIESRQITGITVTVPHLKKNGQLHAYHQVHQIVPRNGVDTIIGGTHAVEGIDVNGEPFKTEGQRVFGRVPKTSKQAIVTDKVRVQLQDLGISEPDYIEASREYGASETESKRAARTQEVMMSGNPLMVAGVARQLISAGMSPDDAQKVLEEHLADARIVGNNPSRRREFGKETETDEERAARRVEIEKAQGRMQSRATWAGEVVGGLSRRFQRTLMKANQGVDVRDPVSVVRGLVAEHKDFHPDAGFDPHSAGLEEPGVLQHTWRQMQKRMLHATYIRSGKSRTPEGIPMVPSQDDLEAAEAWDSLQSRFAEQGGVPNITFQDPHSSLFGQARSRLKGVKEKLKKPSSGLRGGKVAHGRYDLDETIQMVGGTLTAQHLVGGVRQDTDVTLDPTGHKHLMESTTLRDLQEGLMGQRVPRPHDAGNRRTTAGALAHTIRFAAHIDGQQRVVLGRRTSDGFEFLEPDAERADRENVKFAIYAPHQDKWTGMANDDPHVPWKKGAFQSRIRLRGMRQVKEGPQAEWNASRKTPGSDLHQYPLADPGMDFDSGIVHEDGAPLLFSNYEEAKRHIAQLQSALPESQRTHYLLPLNPKTGMPKTDLPKSDRGKAQIVVPGRSGPKADSVGWGGERHQLMITAFQRHMDVAKNYVQYHQDQGDQKTPSIPEPVEQFPQPTPEQPPEPTQSTQTGASGQTMTPVGPKRELPKATTMAGRRARGAGSWRK